MKLESSLDFFILFIVFIKLVFLLSAIGHVVLTHLPKTFKLDVDDAKLVYWKERTEFIFAGHSRCHIAEVESIAKGGPNPQT